MTSNGASALRAIGAGSMPSAAIVCAPLVAELVDEVRATKARVVATASPAGRRSHTGGATDGEAVHDFRVSIRRLRSVLRAVRPVYGKAKMRALGLRLKRFADATGALRDEEVLRETLLGLPLDGAPRAELEAWLARRARQERGRRLGVARMLSGEDGSELDEILDAIQRAVAKGARRASRGHRRKERDRPLVELASRALDRAVATTLEPPFPSPADGAAMHALRIRFKRLRYAAELFERALSPGEVVAEGSSGGSVTVAPEPAASPCPREVAARAGRLAKTAAKLQKRLGELHDLDEAMLRVGRAWGLALETRGVVAAALREARAQVAARAIEELEAAAVRHGRGPGPFAPMRERVDA